MQRKSLAFKKSNNMSSEFLSEENPLQLFEICLQRDEYFPGEVIVGKLLIVTSKPLKAEVFLKFEGRGSVRWKNRSAHLCGLKEAEFVKEKRSYFSNVYRYELDSLAEGSSVLAFELELPTGIPQTIQPNTIMKQLQIWYLVEALVHTTSKVYRQEKCFPVKGILNLIGYPELSFPVCKTIREAVFESCWSPSGRVVVMSFSIKKQGFVPGERIKAELILTDGHNNGEIPLLRVEVMLIQEIEIKIRTATRVRRRVLAKSDMVQVSSPDGKVNGKPSEISTECSNKRKLNFHLTIPEDVLITYGNTDKQVYDFISIQYSLRMAVEQTSFPYKPLQIHLPIKIGTVFIREQKVTAPVILLTPVPLALPRPNLPKENGSKSDRRKNTRNLNEPTTDSCVNASRCNSEPEILIDPSTLGTVMKMKPHACLSNNASPRTPKRKLCPRSNAVGDSAGSLRNTKEAFGDSDSESFRSGIEDLQQIGISLQQLPGKG